MIYNRFRTGFRSFSSVLVLLLLLLGAAGCGRSKNLGGVADSNAKHFAKATPEIKAAWDAAVAATKAKDYAGALDAFGKLSHMPGLTAEQTTGLQATATAVSDAMYDAANNGDADAQKAIEKLRVIKAR